MKIGIDIRLIGKKQTGSEVVFLNLVRNLARIDSENEYLLFTDVTDKDDIKEIKKQLEIIEKENFCIISLETKNRFIWNFWTLPKYLRKSPVDMYQTQYITPWFIPRKIKILTIVHDISFNFFPQFIKFSDLLFLRTLIPVSIRRADRIIGVSKFTYDEIIKYYNIDAERVDYFYNAVDDEWKNKEVTGNRSKEIKKKYALPEKFILYVGTLQPRKNIPQLIEAFARIKDSIGDIKMVIGGNKKAHNFDKGIDEAVKKNGLENEVIFPGFIDEEDKKTVFSMAHVFVFPSLYEGFGIPALEAMSQDVPVLCSDIPSLREVAAEAALYFDTSSLDDFSKKLYDISIDSDLRRKLIRSGETRVSFFSWERAARKMLAIYGELSNNFTDRSYLNKK